ncbi:MAG: type II secretion system protein [Planctomycetes bacterium]|nr:type II secretion system protein [Planctomycetota bacterium]MCW8135892.1 type II secretion system protein [Planctomycetota bacterium]
MPRRRPAGARRHGFTLIELMIVIGIIVVLMSVLVVAFSGAFSKSEEARATATIKTLQANIESYKARWGTAPPSNMQDLGNLMAPNQMLMAPNKTNEGIECLVLALRSRKEGGPYLDVPLFADDARRGNLDLDMVMETAMGPTALDVAEGTSRDLFEILDPWGNPLVYINIVELRQGRVDQTITLASGQQVRITATEAQEKLRHPTTGDYPSDYVLWSFGEDGINDWGRGDDVVSWNKYTD